MGEPKADDFMLPSADDSDDVKFRAPARKGNIVVPLIDGQGVFTAVEDAIAAATESVYCSLWSIYPTTPLLSPTVRSAKLKTWQDLLITVAAKAKIRIIVSDFEPVVDNSHHQRAWRAYNQLTAAAKKARLTKDQFQIIVSLHPASMSNFAITMLSKSKLNGIIKQMNRDAFKGLQDSPGIWSLVAIAGGKL